MHWCNTTLISTQLEDLFRQSIKHAYPQLALSVLEDSLEVTISKQLEHGHYQCNSALKLSKILKDNPRNIAKNIIPSQNSLISNCEIAGPGFINITLSGSHLEALLNPLLKDPRLGIAKVQNPKRIVIDFSSPNTAKELHVGHLRSSIIGDTIARLFEFLGHHVLRLNHIGDWGTPFGMLIHFLKSQKPNVLKDGSQTTLSDLASWYKESRVLFDNNPEFKKLSQEQVVLLQAKETSAMDAWHKICEISRKGYQEIYDLLNIQIQERGESFYHERLPQIVSLLKEKGLTENSNGAECIFLDHFLSKEETPLPLIIQKSDGGYTYATTDLAALYQRIHEEKADRIIYVVDNGQSLHLEMVFQAAQKAGYYDPKKVEVDHVPFGLVLGSDGKKFKTRSGESEKLIDLLKKAILKASEILNERNDHLKDAQRTAQVLGINAVKYADLSSLRTKDYMFSYEKMLRFEGNTAAFLLYSYVRIASIQQKADFSLKKVSHKELSLKNPNEVALALHILQLREVLESVAHGLLPNRICDYLYLLADKFNAFFRDCPVLNSEYESSRLILCELVKRTFEIGFQILGLETVDRM